MVNVTYELAQEVNDEIQDYYGLGVGVSTKTKAALREALEGTGHDLNGSSVVEMRSKAETMDGKGIHYSWETFGGEGVGEAGVVVVVNSIGDEYIANAELYEVVEKAEFTANTLSSEGNQ